jgi:hypothetical protein
MADTTPQPQADAISPDEGITIPRISLQEQGFVGLRTTAGRVFPEANTAFNYPAFTKTVNEMRNNPTVGSAMSVYRMFMSRVNWRVEPHEEAAEIDKQRAAIVNTMMTDMEGSWRTFIEEVIPYLEYGYGIHEKVLRRRLYRNGSAFNDGVVGIAKLAPRNADTIEKWIFSDDGADLLGVRQNIQNIQNSYRFQNRKDENGLIPIDRNKFLLFTASGNRGNPTGNSIYKAIYLSYKMLTLLQDNELLGIAKDIQGILKISIPPKYLDPNASVEDKAVVTAFQGIIDSYNAGTQRGLLVPNMYDDAGNQLFSYELMESRGSAKYDVEAVIKRLQGDILAALNCDILKLGADGTGSFSLAESKSSVLAIAIDYRLREIAEVLNSDLMKTIYQANGWSCEKMAKFVYEDIEDIDMEVMGKFVQQVFSVGGIEADRTVMNRIRKLFGVQALPEDEKVDVEKLPPVMTGKATMAGEGMKTAGPGTAKKPGGKDPSAANANNK